MRGYLVFTVLTEALRPTSGLAVNPQVGPIFGVPLGYLEFFTWQSTTGPREVPELKVRERPPSTSKRRRRAPGRCQSWRFGSAHHQRENVNGGPPGGAGAEGPGASTINVKTLTTGPWKVPELEIRERSACGARPSGRAVNGCRNLGTNDQRVVRTHFTRTRVRHFY
jgi:hypothetical protein